MPATQIVEHGTNDEKTALATRAIAQHSPEGVGFMWAVLNYRLRAVQTAVPAQPLKVSQCARGFAPVANNSPDAIRDIGRWIYANFNEGINISGPVKTQLTAHHETPAHFNAAYAEISGLVNVNFPLEA